MLSASASLVAAVLASSRLICGRVGLQLTSTKALSAIQTFINICTARRSTTTPALFRIKRFSDGSFQKKQSFQNKHDPHRIHVSAAKFRKIAAGRGRLCSRLEIDCMCTSHAMNAAELASCAQQLSRTSRCVYVPVYLAAVPCRVVALTTPGLLARVARRRGWWRPQSSR